MYDEKAILETLNTATAAKTGSAHDLPNGTPIQGLRARFLVTSYASVGTAGTVFQPSIQDSTDGTTWTEIALGTALTGATGATVPGEPQFVPFFTKKRYIRSVMKFNVTSGTPAIIFSSDLTLSAP